MLGKYSGETLENKHQHNETQGFIACWVHSSANMSPHYYVLNELKENTFTRKEWRLLFLAETAVFHPSKPVLYISCRIYPPRAGTNQGAAIACVTFNPDAVQILDEIQVPLCWPDSYSHEIKISPDGQLLIVASWGGGYALYRLNEAGLFDKPISTIHDQPKGNVPSSEAKPVETTGPLRLCLHSDKPVAFGAELKGEQITTLSVSEEGLAVMSRRQLREGSGVPHLAFDSTYKRLFISNAGRKSLSVIRTDRYSGEPIGDIQYVPLSKTPRVLAVHPSEPVLYVAHFPNCQEYDLHGATILSTWHLSSKSLTPRLMATTPVPAAARIHEIHVVGDQLMLPTPQGVFRLTLDPQTHVASHPERAKGGYVQSIAFRPMGTVDIG
jgi:hypothetical protein